MQARRKHRVGRLKELMEVEMQTVDFKRKGCRSGQPLGNDLDRTVLS